jgi:hypothetical protein
MQTGAESIINHITDTGVEFEENLEEDFDWSEVPIGSSFPHVPHTTGL